MWRIGTCLAAMSHPYSITLVKVEESRSKSSLGTTGESRKGEDPSPGPAPITVQSAQSTINASREGSCYHNPNPTVQLIGRENEDKTRVNDTDCLALVDSGVQVSTITVEFAWKLGYEFMTWTGKFK